MSETLFEYRDTHHMTSLRITENEVIINGVSISVSSIRDVVFYPIVQNERGAWRVDQICDRRPPGTAGKGLSERLEDPV